MLAFKGAFTTLSLSQRRWVTLSNLCLVESESCFFNSAEYFIAALSSAFSINLGPQKFDLLFLELATYTLTCSFHDVTQSSFEEPCIPLPGGFSSGLAGRGSNFSGPSPIWNLEITNVSAPIWFFCGATVPTLHCASGMVG